MIHDRARLGAGIRIAGPAIIQESLCTTFVPPGHQAVIGRLGEIVITAAAEQPS